MVSSRIPLFFRDRDKRDGVDKSDDKKDAVDVTELFPAFATPENPVPNEGSLYGTASSVKWVTVEELPKEEDEEEINVPFISFVIPSVFS